MDVFCFPGCRFPVYGYFRSGRMQRRHNIRIYPGFLVFRIWEIVFCAFRMHGKICRRRYERRRRIRICAAFGFCACLVSNAVFHAFRLDFQRIFHESRADRYIRFCSGFVVCRAPGFCIPFKRQCDFVRLQPDFCIWVHPAFIFTAKSVYKILVF